MSNARQSSAQFDDRLTRLGAETPVERRVKRVVPWVISAALHVGIVLLGFLVTWTVVKMGADDAPTLVVADFYASQYEPVAKLDLPEATTNETPHQNQVDAASMQASAAAMQSSAAAKMAALDTEPLRLLSESSSEGALADFAPRPNAGTATFIGLRTSNARKIVYVIDASGSMIRSLPIVIDELARSLERLSPQQSFGIVFFQRNEALVVPPSGKLSPATPQQRQTALEWIKANVIPGGRSNPLKAIEAALALKPDAIYLLSENITGSGQFEIDQADLLSLLNKLNPVDPDTGRRRTQINCIQFLSVDPIDTLRKIAEAHGGPGGYKFLDRAELGLTGP